MRKLALLIALIGAAHAAETPSLEERMRALEARLAAVERENAELRTRLGEPNRSAPASAAAAPGGNAVHGNGNGGGGEGALSFGDGQVLPHGKETRVTIGGFTQMQAEFGGTGDQRFVGATDRIYARRSRLSLVASFAEHFEARLDGEFAVSFVTPTAGLRAQANEIYLNWSQYPAANIRFGQLKPAFGQELLAIEYKGPMVERSLGAERIGDGRQIGGSVFGDLIPGRLSYTVMIANGNGSNTSANDNSKFQETAHVAVVAVDDKTAGKLTLGAGFLHATDNGVTKAGFGLDSVAGGAIDNLFAGTRTGWGVDATWRVGLLELSSELLRMRFSPVNRVPDPHFDAESWQLTAAYYLIPQKFQFAVRREHFDPNLSRRGDSTENWMVGLNYYFKGDDIRFLVDYLFGRAAAVSDNRGRLITRFQIVY